MSKILTQVFAKERTHIVADPATNALLVRARPEDLKQIETLARMLDVEPAKAKKGQ